ncbi:hypothetical protein SteCoe_10840 [Stentor coeruleus]|uniref:Uncharacterized protein n=1 Tax=Stentor coeruleus TaxID=5963 RepID=A0A1R2CEJ6_9CILI|nr:hypothetical protein SteCoe_10840 [Stentor coeruleus]
MNKEEIEGESEISNHEHEKIEEIEHVESAEEEKNFSNSENPKDSKEKSESSKSSKSSKSSGSSRAEEENLNIEDPAIEAQEEDNTATVEPEKSPKSDKGSKSSTGEIQTVQQEENLVEEEKVEVPELDVSKSSKSSESEENEDRYDAENLNEAEKKNIENVEENEKDIEKPEHINEENSIEIKVEEHEMPVVLKDSIDELQAHEVFKRIIHKDSMDDDEDKIENLEEKSLHVEENIVEPAISNKSLSSSSDSEKEEVQEPQRVFRDSLEDVNEATKGVFLESQEHRTENDEKPKTQVHLSSDDKSLKNQSEHSDNKIFSEENLHDKEKISNENKSVTILHESPNKEEAKIKSNLETIENPLQHGSNRNVQNVYMEKQDHFINEPTLSEMSEKNIPVTSKENYEERKILNKIPQKTTTEDRHGKSACGNCSVY